MNRFEKDDVTITDACKNIQNYVQTTCSGGARVSIKCDLYCYAFGEPHKDYAECKIGFGNNSFDLKMYFTDVCDNERVNWTLFGLGREKKPAVFNCER
ncbi:MAG: hypothetical protein FWG18_01545 [Alphaproteobacteria bacterium]|nr:hypothetical protein [Alphaproteobacteria bacterium]